MRILLIHGDVFRWATTIRAEEFKKRWVDDQVDIMFYTTARDADWAIYDIIHILFSGGITQLSMRVSQYHNKTFASLASYRTLEGVYDKIDDLRLLYRQAKGTVCQNKDLLLDLKSLCGEEYAHKFCYIPNGVNEQMFNKEFTVGFVGNKQAGNNDHKGYELIKEACEKLGVRLLSLKDTYENCRIEHEKMVDFYRSIDCLALASRSEGCNNPTLEALAMNIPVISTRVGIAEELEGITYVNRTVESIMQGIRQHYTRKQILENYTWDIIAQKYHDLYVAK